MKKLFLIIPFLFLGCANKNTEINKKIKEREMDKKILSTYNISKDALTKIKENYYFYMPDSNGLAIYKLDKNYQLKQKKVINKLIEGHKLSSDEKNIYLLGYDQTKNQPVLIVLDENLNIKSKKAIGNKFDIPNDMTNEKNPAIVLTTYKNGADIEIYKDGKLKVFNAKGNQLPKFIKKFNGGYIIIGSEQHPDEDLLVVFVKNNKIKWSKLYDFGMEDSPRDIKVKKDKIQIKLISQDYMGAEKYIEVELDKNGTIIKHKKELEFKQLPTRFRT